MRMESLLIGVMCLAFFGCATEPRLLDEFSDQTTPTSNRIVIHASTWSDANGGTSSVYHWVLEKDGKSHGTLHFVPSAGDPGTTTHYEFASGVYEECLAKMEETQFVRINSRGQMPFQSSAQIVIHYQGRKHVVTQRGSPEIDDGFNKMWLFLGDLQKRGTIVRQTSGLAPAGLSPKLR